MASSKPNVDRLCFLKTDWKHLVVLGMHNLDVLRDVETKSPKLVFFLKLKNNSISELPAL